MVCFITAQLKLTLDIGHGADLEDNEWTVSAGAGVRQDVTSDQ